MVRAHDQEIQKKAVPHRRQAFARYGFSCLLAGWGFLLVQFLPAELWAAPGTPSDFYVNENAANILPGTFEPDGNFSNAAVSSNPPQAGTQNAGTQNAGTQNAELPSTPGDLLSARNSNSPGSDELTAGGDRAELPLPEAGAMDIAPINAPLGADAESVLNGSEAKEPELPGASSAETSGISSGSTADSAKNGVNAGAEITAAGSANVPEDSRMTQGREHEGKIVRDVQIIGNSRHSTEKILQQIHMRPSHTFKSANLDDDILRLNQSRLFTLVEPYIRSVDDGVVVIFKVEERPVMRYLRFQGNGPIRIGLLENECGLVPGRPFSPYDVEEGRKKLETFYHFRGYARASIKTIQGDKVGDPGVIYLINPGPKLRIGKTEFIGNTIASDARLKTVVQSKPGFLWIFKGELRDETLQEDIRKLEDYYRRLGFFYARIGRRVKRTSDSGWNDVTFVIEEGPQAHIREIRYVGNEQFDAAALAEDMKIEEGKPFNKDRLDMSIMRVRKRYGRQGYVFADINAEMKMLDDPGQCDIVFSIKEGKTYRVGRVNVVIEGEFPHTQISTVLNRLSVKPGDLVNVYELQQSERRLKSSQLFAVDPAQGQMPKIIYSPPELAEEAEIAAQVGSNAGAVGVSESAQGRGAGSASAGSTSSAGTSSSAGAASLGGGAGRAALSGERTQKVLKTTIADVDESFQLQDNETFMDVNIHTVLRPVEENAGSENSEGNAAGDLTENADGNADGNAVSHSLSEDTAGADAVSDVPAMETVWCMELVDRESGKVFRTYEFPEEEADLLLSGEVCVTNDDPAYGNSPVQVRNRPAKYRHEVRYAPEGDARSADLLNTAVSGNVPLQQIPVSEETESSSGMNEPLLNADYASGQTIHSSELGSGESMAVRGNSPESASPSAHPSWASSELAESAPAAQIESINPRTGQAMAPPPQPGISNPDETPFTPVIGDTPAAGYSLGDWQRQSLPITASAEETTTGRIMFSVGVSSDSGLVGSVVVDEQNFDIRRWPKSWSDIKNNTVWRGRGQHFRMELMPGTEVSRYAVSFDEPYLFNTQIGLGTSAMYYERNYKYWDERRVGGSITFSRALTHDMRAYFGFRGFDVYLDDPVRPTPSRLENALGHSSLFGFSFRLVQDRRDSSFLATEGYYASIEFEQVVGTWSYPRFNAQFKKYWLLYERADMSGRHVLSFTSSFSWTGDDTPIYESYFAGGSSTIRGFEYRGVSPLENGYAVGGNMMILASLEYLFPITADDSIRGVLFCDTGTVESRIDSWDDDYRVAIGAGFRISMPALGPAPMALDFAVPLVREDGDEKELFSFRMGLQR
ncbi:MAG: BamA/TamA family outer membrane protein [Thermoguttaceae bacterium]|nr:BamA/TamA family outer membrane protein [Thermoguttaceae bacterium]